MTSAESRSRRRIRERYGPWTVVTGASDGIGRELARALAEAGVHLLLVARREDVLASFSAELSGQHGVQTQVLATDLALPGGAQELMARAEPLQVGLLAASAGFGTSGSFLAGDVETELQMIDLNCRGVVALSHHFGHRFAEQRRGGLILLSSLVAFQGVPRAAVYAATKAFVQTFAEGLRQELAPRGVDVVASAPGPVSTGFGARAGMSMGKAASPRTVARGTLAALGRRGTVRPGFLAKLLGWSLALLPRWGRVRVMGVIMGGMTSHRG